jgi:P27 family predicted phage terminase small subunit
MGRRGRKPAPTPLKILKGVRRDRINGLEPTPPRHAPEAPKHLEGPAREEWDRMIPLLEEMHVLTAADGAALAVYCQTHARWLAALEEIEKEGIVIESGDPPVYKANPACTVASNCEGLILRMLCEFGMTPSSRSRVSVPSEGESGDDLDHFIAAGG